MREIPCESLDELRTWPNDRLLVARDEAALAERRWQQRRITLDRVLDERGATKGRDAAEWVQSRDKVSAQTARGEVEVARALESLPAIAGRGDRGAPLDGTARTPGRAGDPGDRRRVGAAGGADRAQRAQPARAPATGGDAGGDGGTPSGAGLPVVALPRRRVAARPRADPRRRRRVRRGDPRARDRDDAPGQRQGVGTARCAWRGCAGRAVPPSQPAGRDRADAAGLEADRGGARRVRRAAVGERDADRRRHRATPDRRRRPGARGPRRRPARSGHGRRDPRCAARLPRRARLRRAEYPSAGGRSGSTRTTSSPGVAVGAPTSTTSCSSAAPTTTGSSPTDHGSSTAIPSNPTDCTGTASTTTPTSKPAPAPRPERARLPQPTFDN